MRPLGTVFVFCFALTAADPPGDATAIMTRMAAHMEKAAEVRQQFLYRQTVRGSLIRSGGQIARKESREYSIIPQPASTEKKLVSFTGEYRKGQEMVAYSEPGYKYKDEDIDGELLGELTDDLVNDEKSRDGIPESLFPLRTKDLVSYEFSLKGQTNYKGRPVYRIAFRPGEKAKGLCIQIPDEANGCQQRPWKGEVLVDVEDLQPARIDTSLARGIPWAVRTFLGTNVRQIGFSISYVRVAEGVWFPSTYGTEFHLDVLWFYKRTIALSLENSGFQRTQASSTIQYDLRKSLEQ